MQPRSAGAPETGASSYFLIPDAQSEDRVQRISFRDGLFRFLGFDIHEGGGVEIALPPDGASALAMFIMNHLS